MKIKINTSNNFAPLPIGRVTISAMCYEGASMVLGSNYCWHEPAGWKRRLWRYRIEEEDYFEFLQILRRIGGEVEVEVEVISKITSSLNPPAINLPDPADLDEM